MKSLSMPSIVQVILNITLSVHHSSAYIQSTDSLPAFSYTSYRIRMGLVLSIICPVCLVLYYNEDVLCVGQ